MALGQRPPSALDAYGQQFGGAVQDQYNDMQPAMPPVFTSQGWAGAYGGPPQHMPGQISGANPFGPGPTDTYKPVGITPENTLDAGTLRDYRARFPLTPAAPPAAHGAMGAPAMAHAGNYQLSMAPTASPVSGPTAAPGSNPMGQPPAAQSGLSRFLGGMQRGMMARHGGR